MINILFVVRGDENDVPSSKYRVFQYLPFLDVNNIKYRIVRPPKRRKVQFYLWIPFTIQIFIYGILSKNIFVQKDIFSLYFWKILKYFGKIIIYDFDDAIFIESNLTSKPVYYFPCFNMNSKMIVIKMITISDIIIVANRYLADFAKPYAPNIKIIPMSINIKNYKKKELELGKGNKPIVIGWIGSPHTVQYFDMLEDVFISIISKYPKKVIFKIVTNGKVNVKNIKYTHTPWHHDTEVNDISLFDIGLAPLRNDPFSLGKSSFKLLQYMAIGLPTVCSNVGFNKEIIMNGQNGFLACNDIEWVEYLSLLIENPLIRQDMGNKARKTIEDNFSFEMNAKLFLETIK